MDESRLFEESELYRVLPEASFNPNEFGEMRLAQLTAFSAFGGKWHPNQIA